MASLGTELLLVLLLILVNGLFAMSELAVLSARRARLVHRQSEGDKRAGQVIALKDAPSRFLSTVQVGISLIGIFAGAVGGARLAERLALPMRTIIWLAPYADSIALIVVVLAIAYLSLVIGELVPKRVALSNPERIASLVAPAMKAFARLAAPIVQLLVASTDFVVGLLGVRQSGEPPVTEEEIRILFAQGTQAGVFEDVELDLVESVIRLGDRRASALMTPRPEIVWLDINDSPNEIKRIISDTPYSRFPVADEDMDKVLGQVHVKDILMSMWEKDSCDLAAIMSAPQYVPEQMPALLVFEAFRQYATQMALVIDEYASVVGLVTLTDMLEAIVGDIPTDGEVEEPRAVLRADGSWLIDGMMPVDEWIDLLDVRAIPDDEQGLYQTMAGFVVTQLAHIPATAERFACFGYSFEVVDMDGPRVDKVLVAALPEAEDADIDD